MFATDHFKRVRKVRTIILESKRFKKMCHWSNVLTNTFCKILYYLLFMFLCTSCAHKRSVAKIIRATTRLYRFSNPISLSSYFKNYAYF